MILYNSQDTAALNIARQAGFHTTVMDFVENGIMLSGLKCPLAPACENPSAVLSDAIQALDRFAPNTTVWLQVEPAVHVPRYVTNAIRSLLGYGTRLIVTCGAASTHPPSPPLDQDLCDAVSAANVGGWLWHPLVEKLVNPDPNFTRENY